MGRLERTCFDRPNLTQDNLAVVIIIGDGSTHFVVKFLPVFWVVRETEINHCSSVDPQGPSAR